MNPPQHNSLDRLLRAARRRWIARRAVEASAVGAAIACGVGLLLIAIFWWQAESSINLIACLIGCGALLGALMSLIARPSPMQTANRLDGHHKLHDLLSTAKYLLETQRADDAMQSEIIRQANHTAGELRLAPTMFARMSAPIQTAIVGLVGLTLTVAAIASSHVEQNAERIVQARNGATSPLAASREESLKTGSRENRPISRASDEIQSRATSVDSSKIDGAGGAETKSESRDGNTFAKSGATHNPMSIAPSADSSTNHDGDTASTGGANGNSGSEPSRPGVAANTSACAGRVELSPQSRDAALKLLNNGGVPDAYRDLVRDYFLRD